MDFVIDQKPPGRAPANARVVDDFFLEARVAAAIRQAKVFESTRPWNRLALAPLSMPHLLVTASAKTSAASASHPPRLPQQTEKSSLHTRQSS